MIDRLEVENLKSLDGVHHVELAPITLIYGPNSSGKSSVLQALALLKQSLESSSTRSDATRQPLNLRGDIVDFGSFQAAIHGHKKRRRLSLGVGFSAPAEVGGRLRMRADAHGFVKLGFRFNHRAAAVEQEEVTVGLNGHHVRFIPTKPPDSEGPLYTANERFFRLADKREGKVLLDLVQAMTPSQHVEELVARFSEFMEFDDVQPMFIGHGCFPETPWLRPWRTSARYASELPADGSAMLGNRITDLVFGPAVTLIEILKQLSYLGPMRAAPTRFQVRSGAFYAGVGARGEHTPLFLLQQQGLLQPVNRWLERLNVHYRLQVSPIKADAIGSEIGDLVVTRLLDTRTNLGLTPQDVGFGISQLLPIVVEVLAGHGRTICIEQPEIHIHPRMQTELADLFIEAAQAYDNQVLVETHSEHLMLRVLRRIRETREAGGTGWLTPDKVCVLYVGQNNEGASMLRRLRINSNGEFLDEWPNGFFTERIEELFTKYTSADAGVV